jgi:hypothetical protein
MPAHARDIHITRSNAESPGAAGIAAMIVQRVAGLGLSCLMVLLAGSVVAAPAASAGRHGDGDDIGNGRFNRNAVTINSPSKLIGDQAVSNANAGGSSPVVNGLCKRHRHCLIRQRQRVSSGG